MSKFIRYLTLLCALSGWFGWSATFAESEHEEPVQDQGAERGHKQGAIRMNAGQRAKSGIVSEKVRMRALADEVMAPGEVVMNSYQSSQVTPRIQAQIVARHARLGDRVTTGQRLVTLSSVEMAQAQGNLLITSREWQRVKKLGREVVSERRYLEAQVAHQQALAKVRAFGMTPRQIRSLSEQNDVAEATGAFDLLASQAGIVISDDFVVGEVVEPGRILFELTKETPIWIEARLSPEDAAKITVGARARVSRDGRHWHNGEVIQLHHRLDERTRTQSVRIQVSNTDEELHPGQFVDVALMLGDEGMMKLAVPQSALLLMGGNPVVFTLNGDDIRLQMVQTGATYGKWTEVRAGLANGEEIVVQGAFLLKSLLLKSQMGEGHGH